MSQQFVHQDPKIFPDPTKFNPDRWIRAEDPRKLEKYLVSFSKGARACVGAQLAMAELYIALATTFRRFDLEVWDTTLDDIEPHFDEFVAVPKNGKQKLYVTVQ